MQGYRPKTRSMQLIVHELPDEVLIYDLERNEVHCLNGSAAQVWALCNGERTVEEIAQRIAPDLEAATADSLVWCALEQFSERHLLDEPGEPAEDAEDSDRPREMTRRQMVLGLSLAVGMIPVVESILSPPAALAASGCSGATTGAQGTTPCVVD
jgi:hypothetical protein